MARHQVQDGAQWLAAMANDYWLIARAVREQYADFCVVRAIETRRWVAWASTVGVSGFYTPTGELVAALPLKEQSETMNLAISQECDSNHRIAVAGRGNLLLR